MSWLSTETKGILQKDYDPKPAPPKAGEFGLLLLQKVSDHRRLVRALRRINDCTEAEAEELARSPVPFTINSGLTEEEALSGQFELICCDAPSAFVRSEVLSQQDQYGCGYLLALFEKLLESPEFQSTDVRIHHVPPTEAGERFLDQFLGISRRDETPSRIIIPLKKARIMKHWAARIGARITCDPDPSSEDARELL